MNYCQKCECKTDKLTKLNICEKCFDILREAVRRMYAGS